MSNSAHSLLELLVTFALIAILASVAVWGYASYTEQARVAADEDYVASVYRMIAIENHGDVDAVWISISDGTLAFVSRGSGSDPVQDPTSAGAEAGARPLQSNTYTRGGAQYLTYDGEAFRTASGHDMDLAILRAIYLALGGKGTVEVVTRNGTVDAVRISDQPINDAALPDYLYRITLTSDEYQNTTLTSADGSTWQSV
jgi:type II secretory pathway pseudopilin PulG